MTGLIFWLLEREDLFVRRHAAQAVAVFGAIALLVITLAALAFASLTFLPEGFSFLMVATAIVSAGGIVLWGSAMWSAANGEHWHLGARLLRHFGARVNQHLSPDGVSRGPVR